MMLSLRTGDMPRSRSDGARLIVDCEALADLIAECATILARGRVVVTAPRPLAEATAVRLQLEAGALVAPIALATTVATGCGEGGGEVTLELDPAEQERLAALLERLTAGDPALVAPTLRVLIADDNPHLVELIRAGLIGSRQRVAAGAAAPRFEFALAGDGAAALDRLARTRCDVALIGVYLPPLAPAQVIAQARARWGRDAAIIGLAGEAQPAERLAFAAGADAFMAKPVRLRAIYDAIVALTGGVATRPRA